MCQAASAVSHHSDIGPDDSVSQTAGLQRTNTKGSERFSGSTAKPLSKTANKALSKASSARSKSSRASSSALMEAEVKRAALKAEEDALQEKHALELEEVQLKPKKEALALRTELMKEDAKMQIYNSKKNLQICDTSTEGSNDSSCSETSTDLLLQQRRLQDHRSHFQILHLYQCHQENLLM